MIVDKKKGFSKTTIFNKKVNEYEHINSRKSVLILLKKLSNTKSTNLKIVSIFSLKCAKLSGLEIRMQFYKFSL